MIQGQCYIDIGYLYVFDCLTNPIARIYIIPIASVY